MNSGNIRKNKVKFTSNVIEFPKNQSSNIVSEKSKYKILIRTFVYYISVFFRKALNK